MMGIVDFAYEDDMKYAIRKLDDTEFEKGCIVTVAEDNEGTPPRDRSASRGRSASRSRSRGRSVSRSKSPVDSRSRRSASSPYSLKQEGKRIFKSQTPLEWPLRQVFNTSRPCETG